LILNFLQRRRIATFYEIINIAVYSGGKQDWLAGGLPVEGEAAGSAS